MSLLVKRVSKIKRFLVILLVLIYASSAEGDCFPSPSYQATADKYSCRVHQPNWAPEAYFKITFEHCRKTPTFHVFVRNFYGIDEVNMEFTPAVSGLLTRKFDGKPASLSTGISTFEANPKYNYKTHVQVTVVTGSEEFLVAVFPAHDKSDCSWTDTLPLHHKVMLGVSISIGLAFIGIIIRCCYKHQPCKSARKHQRNAESQNLMSLETSI